MRDEFTYSARTLKNNLWNNDKSDWKLEGWVPINEAKM